MWRELVMTGAALSLVACSVGQGRGAIEGPLRISDCQLQVPNYQLGPTFFTADFVDNPGDSETRRMVTLRIQNGSFEATASDGIYVLIRDVNMLSREQLGVPIDVVDAHDAPVQMTFYAGETCPAGFPEEFWRVPVILDAVSGTITFESVHAPDVDEDQFEFRARFDQVRFIDEGRPDDRNATLTGWFDFLYQRGRPAQAFP